jgi:hydroxyacylglutathione hydrolase
MAQLQVEQIPVLSDNYVYLIHEPRAGVTAVVDPAVAAPVLERLRARGWQLAWILSTHHHVDHTGGNLELKQATGCRIAGPKADAARIPGIDLGLAEGDTFRLGEAEAKVFETPGHTSGHISYWFEGARALFCADTLFSLGCGRLFEGTPAQMYASLQRLAALPPDTRVCCAHEYTLSNLAFARAVEPQRSELEAETARVRALRAQQRPSLPSTIARERETNPFLRCNNAAVRSAAERHAGETLPSAEAVFAALRRWKDSFRAPAI